jgi:hypothetical protein
MTDAWTAAGDRWEAGLAVVVAGLKEGNPDLWTQVGHDSSEFFPLRAWASLGAGGTPNEDLVISVDFACVEGGGVEYRADIACGDGRILAETAVGRIDVSDRKTLPSALSAAMTSVEAFLADHGDLLREHLRAAARTGPLHGRLRAVESRLRHAFPAPWTVADGVDGRRCITIGRSDGEKRLFVRHDLEPAPDADLAFIALARDVLERLLDALDKGDPNAIATSELDRIEAVTDAATSGPWKAFIEERQPLGGSSVIWIGGDDFPADMYLWLADEIAPAELYDFVACARQDIPVLVAEIRRADR